MPLKPLFLPGMVHACTHLGDRDRQQNGKFEGSKHCATRPCLKNKTMFLIPAFRRQNQVNMSSRSAWSTEQVPRWPRLHSEAMSQRKTKPKQKNKNKRTTKPNSFLQELSRTNNVTPLGTMRSRTDQGGGHC